MEFTEYDTRLAAYAVLVDDEQRVVYYAWTWPKAVNGAAAAIPQATVRTR